MPAVSLLIALHVGQGANVILTTKGIDDMCLKYFVEVPLRRWPPCDCGVHPRWEPTLNCRISFLDRVRKPRTQSRPSRGKLLENGCLSAAQRRGDAAQRCREPG